MAEAISSFDGPYRFLSNFFPCSVVYDGLHYQSSEAAYQAAKTTDPAIRETFTRMSASEAKRAGREVPMRPMWDSFKIPVMAAVVYDKFLRNADLKARLMETGHAELIEGNTWGDTFWGVCGGVGENHLGRILMAVRVALREGGK